MATRARRPRTSPAAVDPTLPSVSQGMTVGERAVADSRLGIFWGGQQLVYNPDALQARKGGLRIYDEMRTDPQVKVCLALKVAAILGAGWQLEPGDDSARAKRVADDLTLEFTELQGGTFMSCCEQILRSALQYGFSLTEAVYEAPDLRLIALKSRAPHHFTFELDAYGNILWVEQLQGRGSEPLPMQKFIHFVYQPEFGNPYGRSDLRDVYTDWFHKVAWRQSMAVWGEKLADSPIKFQYPKNETPERLRVTIEALERIQAKSVVGYPEGYLVELLESQKAVREAFLAALDWYNLQISRGMLVPDKLGFAGGEVQGGSYSLSQTQLGAFFFVLDALGQAFDDAVQRQLVKRIMALRQPGDPVPKFRRLPMSDEQRLEVGKLWRELVSGEVVISDVVDENHVRQMLGFRQVDETDQEMRAQLLKERQEQKRMTREQQQATLEATKAPPDEEPMPFAGAELASVLLPGAGPTIDTETYWRPLRPHEQRCDLSEKQATFADLSTSLGATLAERVETMVRSIMARVKAYEPLTADDVRKLTVNRGAEHAFRVALDEGLMRAYGRGQTEAAGELQRARADMAQKRVFARAGLVSTAARKFFRNKAFDVTGKLVTDILAKAKTVLYNALKGDKTSGQVQFELHEALGDFLPERDSAGRVVNVPARVETIARTSGAEAVNEGRYALFSDPDLEGFVQGFMYSAVMDDRTRESHAAWDQVTLPADHPAWFGPPDNRPPCGFNCRCILVPVTAADDVEWTTNIPSEPAAEQGFR